MSALYGEGVADSGDEGEEGSVGEEEVSLTEGEGEGGSHKGRDDINTHTVNVTVIGSMCMSVCGSKREGEGSRGVMVER